MTRTSRPLMSGTERPRGQSGEAIVAAAVDEDGSVGVVVAGHRWGACKTSLQPAGVSIEMTDVFYGLMCHF